jgi:hypothetical protein
MCACTKPLAIIRSWPIPKIDSDIAAFEMRIGQPGKPASRPVGWCFRIEFDRSTYARLPIVAYAAPKPVTTTDPEQYVLTW